MSSTQKRPQKELLLLSDYFLLLAIVGFFFEGSIRKWVLPDKHILTYFCAMSKEIFAFIAVILSQRFSEVTLLTRYSRFFLGLPLILTVLGCLIGAFSEISILGAIMTIRALIAIPIGACLLGRIVDKRLLWPAIYTVAFGVMVNAPLAIVQYYSPADSLINCYVGGITEGIATTGFNDSVRATGTFSYISGLGTGGIVGVAIGIVALNLGNGTLQRALGFGCIMGGLVMALATVSRGPVIVSFFLVAVAAYRTRALLPLLIFAVIPLLVSLLAFENWNDQLEVLSSVFVRSQGADSTLERIARPFFDMVECLQAYPFGEGLGIGQTVNARFVEKQAVESELGRVIYEIGIIGFAGYLLTYVGAITHVYFAGRSFKSPLLKISYYIACMWMFLLIMMGVAFNHISSIVFWVSFVCLAIIYDRVRVPAQPARLPVERRELPTVQLPY